MKNFLPKFSINLVVIPTVILILISGRYKPFFVFFLLSFIHELGHILMAKIQKLNVSKVEMLPFGFQATIEGANYHKSNKELLVAIAGPLMFFVNNILLDFLFNIGFLSYVAKVNAYEANLLILIFNLLPIYPLDGAVILKCLLDKFLPRKKTMYSILLISFNVFLLLIVATSHNPQWIIYMFLMFYQIYYLLTIDNQWKLFLISRNNKQGKYQVKVHDKNDLYRDKENYILNDKGIDDENDFISKELVSSKRD